MDLPGIQSRGLGSEFTSSLYTRSVMLQSIIGITTASISVLAVVVTFYLFGKMERTFRHWLIMMLLFSDLVKALVYVISPIIRFARTVESDSGLCQAGGFALAFGIESADFAILGMAIHAYNCIFNVVPYPTDPEVLIQGYFGMLYMGPPFVLAGLGCWLGKKYINLGPVCYLPLRPYWLRLALSWIPRYVILFIIFTLYARIYFHVSRKFKRYQKRRSGHDNTGIEMQSLDQRTRPSVVDGQQDQEVAGSSGTAAVPAGPSSQNAVQAGSSTQNRSSSIPTLERHGLIRSDSEAGAQSLNDPNSPSYEQYTFNTVRPLPPIPSFERLECPVPEATRPLRRTRKFGSDGTGSENERQTTWDIIEALRTTAPSDGLDGAEDAESTVPGPQGKGKAKVAVNTTDSQGTSLVENHGDIPNVSRNPTQEVITENDESDADATQLATSDQGEDNAASYKGKGKARMVGNGNETRDPDEIQAVKVTNNASQTRNSDEILPVNDPGRSVNNSSVEQSLPAVTQGANAADNQESLIRNADGSLKPHPRTGYKVDQLGQPGIWRGRHPMMEDYDAERRQELIMRQLRLMLIYPMIYLVVWTIPFIQHCLYYNDNYSSNPNLGLACTSAAIICLQGLVDSMFFCWREKPWLYKRDRVFDEPRSKSALSKRSRSGTDRTKTPGITATTTITTNTQQADTVEDVEAARSAENRKSIRDFDWDKAWDLHWWRKQAQPSRGKRDAEMATEARHARKRLHEENVSARSQQKVGDRERKASIARRRGHGKDWWEVEGKKRNDSVLLGLDGTKVKDNGEGASTVPTTVVEEAGPSHMSSALPDRFR